MHMFAVTHNMPSEHLPEQTVHALHCCLAVLHGSCAPSLLQAMLTY
jgi:hypothetical protein